MTRILFPFLLAFSFLAQPCLATTDESKELRKQRLDAQRERQQQVTERNREVNDAARAFRDYTRDLRTDYQARISDLNTEFELRRVELMAAHDARVAGAEADYQKSLSGLFMHPGVVHPGVEFNDEAVRQRVRDGLCAYNAEHPGSSFRIQRVLLMDEPPSIDGNELTDKGYINQRAALQRRAALVERLYAVRPDAEVIEIV